MNPYLIDEAAEMQTEHGLPFGETAAGAAVLEMAREYVKLTQAPNRLMPLNEFVVRKEDMSANGRLSLLREEDGDICGAIIEDDGSSTDIQFCVPGTGGGRSPKTLAALHQLALAMLEDNRADPARSARC